MNPKDKIKMVKMVKRGRKPISRQKYKALENFEKFIKKSIVEIPSFFFYLLIKGNCFYNWVLFSVFYDDGAQDYRLAKMHEIGKMWPLTSIISVRQWDPTNIALEIVLDLSDLSFEQGYLMGFYWRTELWLIEKWHEGAVRLCLEPHNMTRQWDPNFLFSLVYSTQLKVSRIDGIRLGYHWRTFYHMLGIWYLFQSAFFVQILMNFNEKNETAVNFRR